MTINTWNCGEQFGRNARVQAFGKENRMNKCLCNECGWIGEAGEVLDAPNPFSAEDRVSGCPRCFSITSITITCGTPTDIGYVRSCGEHKPKN